MNTGSCSDDYADISIIWDIRRCSLVKTDRHFGGISRFHLQGWKVSRGRNQHEADSNWSCENIKTHISILCGEASNLFARRLEKLSIRTARQVRYLSFRLQCRTSLLSACLIWASCLSYFQPSRWRWYVLPKHRFTSTGLHRIISQKIEFFKGCEALIILFVPY
jgi:hypothetical protein